MKSKKDKDVDSTLTDVKFEGDAYSLLNKNCDDLVYRYIHNQRNLRPETYYNQTKWYWILGFIFSLCSSFLAATSFYNIIKKNDENPMLFKRVDGVEIEESMDIRREILMKNSLRQVEIKKENNG